MRTPHPNLMSAFYTAPAQNLKFPTRAEVAEYRPDQSPSSAEFEIDIEPVATEVATEVRTAIKCGEFGYWCHGTCQRHGKCMYLPRELRAIPPGTKPTFSLTDEAFTAGGVKCANEKCGGWRTRTSKYCSKACGSRKSSRDSYLRRKLKREAEESGRDLFESYSRAEAEPTSFRARLCDDAGMVSHEPVACPEILRPEWTYLKQLNHLRQRSGFPAYGGKPFPCTGHAHFGREHIICASPIHENPIWVSLVQVET